MFQISINYTDLSFKSEIQRKENYEIQMSFKTVDNTYIHNNKCRRREHVLRNEF